MFNFLRKSVSLLTCYFNPHITTLAWFFLLNVPVLRHYSQWHPTKGTRSRITFMALFWLLCRHCGLSLCHLLRSARFVFQNVESHGHLIVLKTKQNTNPSEACHGPLGTGLTMALCCPASDLLSALGCTPLFVLASS